MTPAADAALARLLQLASPALPVGAYSYSQGLESAVEAGIVTDAASARRWIEDVLEQSVATMEAPVLARILRAWKSGDAQAAARWNALFLAGRETAELRAETVQMGYSLARLLADLGEDGEGRLAAIDEIAYPAAFAAAAAAWNIDEARAITAYLWSWIENQVMAAVKLLPLGQTEGQRMLLALGERIGPLAERAAALEDDALCNFAPGLAMLSSTHETQYSRLFRS